MSAVVRQYTVTRHENPRDLVSAEGWYAVFAGDVMLPLVVWAVCDVYDVVYEQREGETYPQAFPASDAHPWVCGLYASSDGNLSVAEGQENFARYQRKHG